MTGQPANENRGIYAHGSLSRARGAYPARPRSRLAGAKEARNAFLASATKERLTQTNRHHWPVSADPCELLVAALRPTTEGEAVSVICIPDTNWDTTHGIPIGRGVGWTGWVRWTTGGQRPPDLMGI